MARYPKPKPQSTESDSSNALASSIISDLSSTKFVFRTIQRMHVPSGDIPDLEQSLYLYWLQSPSSLLEAHSNGYLNQFVVKCCQNAVCNYRRSQVSNSIFVPLDSTSIYL